MVHNIIKNMPIGVGGSTAAIELTKLTNMTQDVQVITKAEYKQRIKKLSN